MFINKKYTILFLVLILSFGSFQVIQALTKTIGETADITVFCSDVDGNLAQCNITSPILKTCAASGYSWSCSGSFTCTTPGTYDACGQARDAREEPSDNRCLATVTCQAPPNKPSILSEAWDDCTFKQLSIPTFYWDYSPSDPESTPQGGYQIKVYGETILDLTSDIPSTSYTPIYPPYDYDWVRNNLLFEEKTYSWQVRVKDADGIWSDWSALKYFQTRKHPYPWISFNWNPEKPVVNEVVQFCSVFQADICEEEPEKGWTECFAPPCAWSWTFQDALPSDSDSENPETAFTSTGPKTVTLTVADSHGYSCPRSETVNPAFPLPQWREIAPF